MQKPHDSAQLSFINFGFLSHSPPSAQEPQAAAASPHGAESSAAASAKSRQARQNIVGKQQRASLSLRRELRGGIDEGDEHSLRDRPRLRLLAHSRGPLDPQHGESPDHTHPLSSPTPGAHPRRPRTHSLLSLSETHTGRPLLCTV